MSTANQGGNMKKESKQMLTLRKELDALKVGLVHVGWQHIGNRSVFYPVNKPPVDIEKFRPVYAEKDHG